MTCNLYLTGKDDNTMKCKQTQKNMTSNRRQNFQQRSGYIKEIFQQYQKILDFYVYTLEICDPFYI